MLALHSKTAQSKKCKRKEAAERWQKAAACAATRSLLRFHCCCCRCRRQKGFGQRSRPIPRRPRAAKKRQKAAGNCPFARRLLEKRSSATNFDGCVSLLLGVFVAVLLVVAAVHCLIFFFCQKKFKAISK